MKQFLLFSFIFSSIITFAQPSIVYDESHSIGITGDLYIISGTTTSLQQLGSNLIWDFSTNTITLAGSFNILDPATTPEGVNYPDANTCLKQQISGQGENYTYVTDTPTELLSLAAEIGGNNATVWIQPDKLIEYPFNYLDSFESTRQSSTGFPQTFTRTFDAYGTLIINGNTYTDVVRVNREPGYAVWYTSSPTWFPIIIEISESFYSYNEPDFSASTAEYKNSISDISIYPNPSRDIAMISVSNELVGHNLFVYDSMGKMVQYETIKNTNQQISTGSLPSGIYTLVVVSEHQNISRIFMRE